MKLYQGECSVEYNGRGKTTLAPATRLVMIKQDGSVAIHNDKGFKPLNYMNAPTTIIEENSQTLKIRGKKESLTIIFTQSPQIILLDNIVVDDPGLTRHGTETELQEWISNNLHIISEQYSNIAQGKIKLVKREYDTGDGPIDIMARDNEKYYAIEVKRNATTPAVHQLKRYISSLKKNEPSKTFIPILIAESFNPSSLKKIEEYGYYHVIVPENWKQENKQNISNLFDL